MGHGADLRRVTVKIVRSSPGRKGILAQYLKDRFGEGKGCMGLEKANLQSWID